MPSPLKKLCRKLETTKVELDRANARANEAESKIQQLEEQLIELNDVLELAETNAVKTNEENEAKIK